MPKKDLWSYLCESDKKIVMYGMGNGADKILSICERRGIEVSDFFASDGFVRGTIQVSDVSLKISVGKPSLPV